ncbi:MAG: dihydrofolate reductase family protein [Candidatus Fimousia sp.]
MERPYITCHMMVSLDGKIIGDYMVTEVAEKINSEYERIHDEFQADAWMCGRVTMDDNVTFYEEPELPHITERIPHTDYIAQKDAGSYVIAVDPSGRLGWKEDNIHGYAKRPPAHIVEVLTERASDGYLAYLQELGISYIFAGKEHVDCELLVYKLKELFEIKRLLLEGGGFLNGSFMVAGLIDELSLVVVPIADGDSDTVTLFEKADYIEKGIPMEFQLENVNRLGESGLWLQYKTKKNQLGG